MVSNRHRPICVIGSIVYDLVMTVEHLPSVGETVPASGFNTFIGGKGLNQAVQIHRLDAPLAFFGRIGNDHYGTEVLEVLTSEVFPTDGIKIVDGDHTAIGMIYVAPDGRNLIGGFRAANMNYQVDEIDEAAHEAIKNASIVSLQLETPDDVVEKCLRLAKDAGVPTLLNAAPWRDLPYSFQELVDYWCVNEIECGQFANCEIRTAIDCNVLNDHKPIIEGEQTWVVTLGDRGAAVVDTSGVTEIPGIKVNAVDSTGAGDSFTGGFAVGIAEGMNPVEAARFANSVAAQSVTKLGGMTGLPVRSEIMITSSITDPVTG
jgi:ribokinase